ncbi:FtsH protease activity modulator HflK [bacterium]|nr:FtsH protease activity modulator HflK [bacterium]
MFDDAFGQNRNININPGCFMKAFWGTVAIWLLFSSVFQVQPQYTAVVRQFGRFVRTADPGLNFKWPSPIETVVLVPTREQLKEEFGFRTLRAGVRSEYKSDGMDDVRLMLTGDLNVADVQWVVQYTISDPQAWLFNTRNPTETLRDLSEVSMRKVVGDRLVDEVLTSGRDEIQLEVKILLQEAMTLYGTGVTIDLVQLQDVNPPDPVKPAFNAVNEATQEKERLINQAQQEYNQQIPMARGEAEKTVSESEGYASRRVNEARGDVARFNAVRAAWENAKEVTEVRLYLEAMEELVARVAKILVMDGRVPSFLPYMDLGASQ